MDCKRDAGIRRDNGKPAIGARDEIIANVLQVDSFKDFDRNAWYAEAVSAAVDNGLLYGRNSNVIDPNGNLTRAEMAAIINRAFGCYKTADMSHNEEVTKCQEQ